MIQGMSRDAWDEFSKTILVSYIVSYLCGSFYLDRSASLKKIVAFSDRCLSTRALTCLIELRTFYFCLSSSSYDYKEAFAEERKVAVNRWAQLLEAWLALTSV